MISLYMLQLWYRKRSPVSQRGTKYSCGLVLHKSVVVICPGRSQAVDSIQAVRLDRLGMSWGEVPTAAAGLAEDRGWADTGGCTRLGEAQEVREHIHSVDSDPHAIHKSNNSRYETNSWESMERSKSQSTCVSWLQTQTRYCIVDRAAFDHCRCRPH